MKKRPYEYFSVSADILVLRRQPKVWEILLIKRKHAPFQGSWALPGGFLDRKEDAWHAARRELKEETGLKASKFTQFGAYSAPDRDPRGRVVTIAFYTELTRRNSTAVAGDDASEAEFFSIKKLPRLAFDHRKVIRQGLKCFFSHKT